MAQKIKAADYFTNSPFHAEIIEGKPESSYKTSTVSYSLTCKECGHKYTRRGNAKTLNKCAGCKLEWEHPDVVLGGAVTRSRKAPIQRDVMVDEPEEEPDTEEAKEAKKKFDDTVNHAIKLFTGEADEARPPPKKKKDAAKEKTTWVEDIIDYYDEYVNKYWHRFYRVKIFEQDELDFMRDDLFENYDLVEEFEASLPEEQRLKVKWPNRATAYKSNGRNKDRRTKEDVLADEAATPVEEDSDDDYYEVIITRTIRVKKGETFVSPEGFTCQVIEKK